PSPSRRTPAAGPRSAATSHRCAAAPPPRSGAPGRQRIQPLQATQPPPHLPDLPDLPDLSALQADVSHSYSSASTSDPRTADSAGQIAATNAAPRIVGTSPSATRTGNT